ncbi:signal peptidase I [Parashewanella curva]|uniref:Signal peptidase I n=1 Tax=Parashewanella curva TaxID=2338552 RepID=A0A3L8PU47_9GAMM|nr:signal peptidase I [Parashewanella curva]RLV58921.1 signal peptidase I [Parashewanella curva]
MKNWLLKSFKDNKGLIIFLLLMSVFRSAVADWYTVPTGSMKPTILEGDRILANKMAYDVRIPFTHTSLYKMSDPQRGDIIIFESKVADERLIKRVIGVPGDVIELNKNKLSINGKSLSYQSISSNGLVDDKQENLLGIKHKIRTDKTNSDYASFDTVTVPNGHYLVLGDNRDHSADSRMIGFVPRNEIIGRSKQVIMSLNYDNHYLPRSNRFFQDL